MKNNIIAEQSLRKYENKEGKGSIEIDSHDYMELVKDMTFFDPYICMDSHSEDNFQVMTKTGVVAIVEHAFQLGKPRTGTAPFKDYYNSLQRWERFRSLQFGIKHYCTIGLNSKEANNEELSEQLVSILPLYLRKEGVVGIGSIGFENQTKSEEKCFRLQLDIAKKNKLPVQICTPHNDKKRATQLSMDICKEHGIDTYMVIIGNNNEETIKSVIDRGFWASFAGCSSVKSGNERVIDIIQQYGTEKIMISSTSELGVSDSQALAKTAALMKMKGFSNQDIKKVTYQNAIDAFGQSGQIYVQDFQKINLDYKSNAYQLNEALQSNKQNQNAQAFL